METLTLFYELSDRLDPGPGHQADQEGRPAQLVRHVDQALALPAHPLDAWHKMLSSHPTPETGQLWTLTLLVTRGGGLVQNCPAPVVSVPPGRAPLDQQLHDLNVGARSRQVQRGLVWRSGPGAIIRVFPSSYNVSEPGARAGPAPEQGPGQLSPAQGHGEVEGSQGVDVTLVQGEVILDSEDLRTIHSK